MSSLIDLHMPCPAVDCPNPDKSKKYWPHYNCGGNTKLDMDSCEIMCPKCKQRNVVVSWIFKCAAHDFREGSLHGWIYSMNVMAQALPDPTKLTVCMFKLNEQFAKRKG